ncbi:hypothetical protein HDR61_00300 [bacterium]|nr:hypothetical protein [bacterium]
MKIKYTLPYVLSSIIALSCGHTSGTTLSAHRNIPALQSIRGYIPQFHSDIDNVQYTLSDSLPVPRPISVEESHKKLLYICDTGDTICRSNGSRAWRNNNPGNLVYGQFAIDNGAIGKGGRFAVFPDEETGRAALAELLRGKGYANLTIGRAIIKYAPPRENNVVLYHTKLRKLTGLELNIKLCDLTDDQLERVVDAISIIEGWTPGTETTLTAAPAHKKSATELAWTKANTMRTNMQNTQKTL